VTNILNAKLFARLHLNGVSGRFLETEVQPDAARLVYGTGALFQFTAAAILKLHGLLCADIVDSGIISVGAFTMSVGLALLIINDARNLTRRFLEFSSM